MDETLLVKSSSGGVFPEFAKDIISKGGLVIGAAWTRGCRGVEHVIIDNVQELARLQGSKYVQSDLSAVWRSLEDILSHGRTVLFSGTPCQIAAVKSRLKDHSHVTFCSLICHSVPMQEVWAKYVEELSFSGMHEIKQIIFRGKANGWSNPELVVEYLDNYKILRKSLYDDSFANSFFKGYSAKASCLNCQFKENRCGADIVIGDFWGISGRFPSFDDDKGVSCVMVYTEKGRHLLNRCAGIESLQCDYKDIVLENPFYVRTINVDSKKRNYFLSHFRVTGVSQAMADISRKFAIHDILILWRRRVGRVCAIALGWINKHSS